MLDRILKSRKALALIAAILLPIIIFTWGLSKYNGIQKTMVAKEQTLSAKYTDNQNVLSNYKASILEAMGVANAATAAQDKVLTDVIAGRGSTGKGGSAFSAIVEAYPDVKNLNDNFSKIQTAILAGREAFKNQQTALLDLLRDYQTWKNSGWPQSSFIAMVGAPSDNLEACVGRDCVTGEKALRKMKLIILTKDTKKAFSTGTDEPLNFGGNN